MLFNHMKKVSYCWPFILKMCHSSKLTIHDLYIFWGWERIRKKANCCDAPCFQPITALRSTCFGGSPCVVLDAIRPRGDTRWLVGGLKQLLYRPPRCPPHLERLCSLKQHTASRRAECWERCQREVMPPGAARSRPSAGSPSTMPLTCPRTTPRLREGLCSALRQEVLGHVRGRKVRKKKWSLSGTKRTVIKGWKHIWDKKQVYKRDVKGHLKKYEETYMEK